ncbi:cytochrome c oxidase assembly protein [Methylophaga muralis]|uniref:Cytochrome c oxidase caa3 assembly factor n=1 Tax=Methylophaga muralis TaxID=291169 RepID=A0A1E3GQD3_9GAMM|nr:cytochrome c oxidase assembly protein [Methylophaga muralis]ODN65776.1 Cytochrome c oxidase caa3 assembly factor [Methylophaga muralis]
MLLTTVDLLCSVIFVITLHQWAVANQLLSRPLLFIVGNVVFLSGMLPWFDALARYSIWLHSAQSVMVHHLAPLLWISALQHRSTRPIANSVAVSHWPFTLMMSGFAVLTWVWMLPELHPLFMQSALLYSVMKWLMALSGIALCLMMIRKHQQTSYWQNLTLLTVIMPLVLWGLLMLVFPNMYSETHSGPHHHHMMMNNLPDWLQLSAVADQYLGGLIFILAGLTYWQAGTSGIKLTRHARRFAK